jgi:proto-oncogene tyrosine-protein kinase ROS
MFDHVTSLATANSLFYWTDGETVLGEEYHPGSDSYYHHTYPQLASMALFNLAILLPAAQPTPVPVNPPSALQAVLGHNSAKVAWQAPHLLGGQGNLFYNYCI